jgi:hypothetical protein
MSTIPKNHPLYNGTTEKTVNGKIPAFNIVSKLKKLKTVHNELFTPKMESKEKENAVVRANSGCEINIPNKIRLSHRGQGRGVYDTLITGM